VGGLKGDASGADIFDQRQLLRGGMNVQVPVLNSTIRLGKDMKHVTRGTVNVRDVFARWFDWREEFGAEEVIE